MKIVHLIAGIALSATPSLAEETTQLDAHEHGVGQLNIAFDENKVAMELHAPGADIVGFEYGAKSDVDLAAIDAALQTLSDPLGLFLLPEAASCIVITAHAKLESEDSDHDDHDEEGHDDHDDEGHDDHDEAPGHTEFHAEYLLECANLTEMSAITFSYFEIFPNALELEVQVISDKGATAFEIERDVAKLDLRGIF
ncbi:MAG: DUF2796 domain-containing protein [Planktomarina sp.]|nr:DUF2796 domain-containing protein [Planktomarina sp.]MDT2049821.1 DUF2796 domain-containing protein [Planktomarina sp.]